MAAEDITTELARSPSASRFTKRRHAPAKPARAQAGYDVVPVGDGRSALRVLAELERVDVLFTDVVLGGELNGRQVAEEAKKLRPNLHVLFTTGYTRNAIVHHGRLDAGVNLLNKPYTSHELTDSVRRLMDR